MERGFEQSMFGQADMEKGHLRREGTFEEYKWKIGKLAIECFGITHNPQTVEKHRMAIEQSVARADGVVLEYLPQEIYKINQFIGDAFMKFDHSYQAYDLIARIAHEHGKPIFCLDPDNFYIHMYNSFGEFGLSLILLNISVSNITAILRKIKEKEKMNRRDFLKGTGGLLASGVLGYQTWSMPLVRFLLLQNRKSIERDFSEYGLDDKVFIDTRNYRNITVAQNLETMADRAPKELNLSMFYGAYHPKIIDEYIHGNHKIEKSIKKLPHAFYNLIGKESIRVYVPQKNQQWDKLNFTEWCSQNA